MIDCLVLPGESAAVPPVYPKSKIARKKGHDFSIFPKKVQIQSKRLLPLLHIQVSGAGLQAQAGNFVVKGLQDKETRNARGEATWSALEKYVRRKVPSEGPKFLRGGNKQTPVAASGGLDGDPVLLVRPKQ